MQLNSYNNHHHHQQIKKWTKILNRYFSKEHTNGQHIHEKVLNTANYQGNEIKTTMRYHLTPVKIAIIKKTRDNKC